MPEPRLASSPPTTPFHTLAARVVSRLLVFGRIWLFLLLLVGAWQSSACALESSYRVLDGGDASYNGTYTANGTYNGTTAFSKDATHWLYYIPFGGTGNWYLAGSKGGAASYNLPAAGNADSFSPGSWQFGPGPAPAPLVIGTPDSTPPYFVSAATDTTGSYIDVRLHDSYSPMLLPATEITGFSVLVNSVARTVLSAARKATTPDQYADAARGTARLTLASVVMPGDVVTVSYTPGNATDSASTPNALLAFAGPVDKPVTNNSTVLPAAPIGLSATPFSRSQLNLAWTASTTPGVMIFP